MPGTAFLGAAQPVDLFDEQHIGVRTQLMAWWKLYQGVQVTLRTELDDDEKEQW